MMEMQDTLKTSLGFWNVLPEVVNIGVGVAVTDNATFFGANF